MPETSRIFFLDSKKKVLEDAEKLSTHPWVNLPPELDRAVRIAVTALDAALNSTIDTALENESPLFFAEHWNEGRTSSNFSIPVFLESIRETLPAHSKIKLSIALPFNLFESGAAREDHDHYKTLSEIFIEGSLNFRLFLFRPTHAITQWHLFTLSDFPLGDATAVIGRIKSLLTEMIQIESDDDFPLEAPKWAQTFSRRKQEILSLEHWKNLYQNRIVEDLATFSDEFPVGYLSGWDALGKALTELYSIEAAERNHRLKETLFSFAPILHDAPDFYSIISRTARAFFPGVHFILEERAALENFRLGLESIPLTPEVAHRVLEGAEEFLAQYSDTLEKSRTPLPIHRSSS